MNNFDLNWFTSVPGMLISCGVLLLIVALIVFIVSSAKGKKEKNPLKEENVAAAVPAPAVPPALSLIHI